MAICHDKDWYKGSYAYEVGLRILKVVVLFCMVAKKR